MNLGFFFIILIIWLYNMFMLRLLMLISLVGEISEVPQGTHKMEQKVILSLLIHSNTVPHQSSHKETVFLQFYRTIFV